MQTLSRTRVINTLAATERSPRFGSLPPQRSETACSARVPCRVDGGLSCTGDRFMPGAMSPRPVPRGLGVPPMSPRPVVPRGLGGEPHRAMSPRPVPRGHHLHLPHDPVGEGHLPTIRREEHDLLRRGSPGPAFRSSRSRIFATAAAGSSSWATTNAPSSSSSSNRAPSPSFVVGREELELEQRSDPILGKPSFGRNMSSVAFSGGGASSVVVGGGRRPSFGTSGGFSGGGLSAGGSTAGARQPSFGGGERSGRGGSSGGERSILDSIAVRRDRSDRFPRDRALDRYLPPVERALPGERSIASHSRACQTGGVGGAGTPGAGSAPAFAFRPGR